MGAALGATGAAYIIAVGLPSLLWLGVIAWFGIGFASAAYLDAKYTFFRGAVAPEKIGRLVSNMYLFPGITSSIGALVISAVAVTGESVHLGVAVGGGLIAAGVLGLALPRVRRTALLTDELGQRYGIHEGSSPPHRPEGTAAHARSVRPPVDAPRCLRGGSP